MALKFAGWSKLTEFVADHIFADKDGGQWVLPLWTAMVRPTISGEMADWRAQVLITVRSSAEREQQLSSRVCSPRMDLSSDSETLFPLSFVATAHDHLISFLIMTGTITKGELTPRMCGELYRYRDDHRHHHRGGDQLRSSRRRERSGGCPCGGGGRGTNLNVLVLFVADGADGGFTVD